MRILLVSRFFPYIGGRERTVLSLSRTLSRHHVVSVATPDVGIVDRHFDIVGIKPTTLANYVSHFKPDIINSHTYYLTPQLLQIAQDQRVPVCLTIHTDIFNYGSNEAKITFGLLAEKVDGVITVCNHGLQQMIKNDISRAKLKRIYPGVDLSVFHELPIERTIVRPIFQLPYDKFVFITPARMTEYKGLEVLLKAIAQIDANDRKQMAFWIVSPASRYREDEADYAKKLLNLAIQMNLDESEFVISFLGFNSMPFAYKAADAFILPSLTEQLPVSILEAMASRLPVIATNVGGIREIVRPNLGLLIQPNSPAQLESAIIKIFKNKALSEKLGRSSREYVATYFSQEKMADEYVRKYSQILGKYG